MNEEVKSALSALKEGLEKKTQGELDKLTQELEAKLEGLVAEEKIEDLASGLKELKEHNEALQKHLDELDVALQSKSKKEEKDMHPVELYYKKMEESITENAKSIAEVGEQKAKFRMEVKAPMLLSSNLTGDPVKTYQSNLVEIPFQRINFSELIPNIQSATGVYTYYVEGPVTGAPDYQTEGADKEEVNTNITEVICNARYLAGWTQISKQMLQDLPFLNSFLPRMLRREYFKAENADFYNTLTSVAAGTSTGTGGLKGMIEDIGVIEAADFDVTGIVVNPADWAALAADTVPGSNQSAVVSFVNGNMFLAGVPVFKASWVAAGQYVMGDWFWAKKIVVDGLGVTFSEEDRDNFIKNLVTVKVESRICLAIEQPGAFLVGSIAAST